MIPPFRKWLGLFGMISAVALSFLDQSILPVALPTMRDQLDLSLNEVQWCMNAYLLTTAVFVLVGGKLGDLWGHRRVFCSGLFLFGLASALCALSHTGAVLIFARALQGLGASLMFPNSATLTMSLVRPDERGRTNGINVSVGSIFLILGPLIGGFITENYTWPWIFWINLPLTLVSLALVLLFVPATSAREGKIDLPGFLYFSVGITALILLLMNGREWGWTSPIACILALLSVGGAVCLVRREAHAPHPFLELTLFQHAHFRAAVLGISAVAFIMMISLYWALYFQDALHYSPLATGTITFCASLPVMIMAPISGYIADRLGPKLPIATGFACLIASFSWMAYFNDRPLPIMLPGLFAYGVGVTLVLTPMYTAITHAISPQKWGIAYGVLSTFRYVFCTLGVALIGTSLEEIQLWNGSFKVAFSLTNGGLALLLAVAFALVFSLYNRVVK